MQAHETLLLSHCATRGSQCFYHKPCVITEPKLTPAGVYDFFRSPQQVSESEVWWNTWAGAGVKFSVQAAEDEGGWQTGGLCSNWRIANAELLYHRNTFFDFVSTSVTGRLTCTLYLVWSGVHNLLLLVKGTRKQCVPLKCNNSNRVSAKPKEMYFTLGYS